jgi:hypothetical protein
VGALDISANPEYCTDVSSFYRYIVLNSGIGSMTGAFTSTNLHGNEKQNTESKKVQLAWSVGLIPVQEWIAEATRSRDLRIGSAFLSHAMALVLKRLDEARIGAEVELPAVQDSKTLAKLGDLSGALSSDYSLPNRATGVVSAKRSLDNVAAVFERLQSDVVDEAWQQLAQKARERGFGGDASSAWNEVRGHLDNVRCPIHLVWVLHEFESCTSRVNAIAEIDRLYEAVKQTRPFPSHKGFPVEKCSQCGRREALGGQDITEWRQFDRELETCREALRGTFIESGERLCPVCMVKRLAGYATMSEGFPSTPEIACRAWLEAVKGVWNTHPGIRQAFENWQRMVKSFEGPSGYGLLYKNVLQRRDKTLRERMPQESGRHKDLAKIEDIVRLHGSFFEAVKSLKQEDRPGAFTNEPSSYLAVMVFDGDNMGKKVKEHLDSLPAKVMEFSQNLPRTIQGHLAQSFYLGGDEGLILCPIETALALARAIRDHWMRTVKDGDQPFTTLSMGMVLFHRERPMSAAIEEAHAAIERAKALDTPAEGNGGRRKKDALSVVVETASGNRFEVVDHWDGLWGRIEAAVELLRSKELSMGWPYDVESFLRSFPLDEPFEDEGVLAAVREEIKRLTFRRVGENGNGPAIWGRLGGDGMLKHADLPGGLARIIDQFHLMAFLAREFAVDPPKQSPSKAPEPAREEA